MIEARGSFAELLQRIARPESLRHKSYRVAQDDGYARMHQNEAFLPLTAGETDGLWSELAGILLDSWRGTGRGSNVYPSLDPSRLRESYARYLGVAAQCVEVFAGSSDALHTIAAGCFRPGGRVAFFEPSFSILRDMVSFWGAQYVPIPLAPDFSVDPAALLSKEVLEADVVILCTPNNPTGAVTPSDLIRTLVGKSSGLVVIDEAYFEFACAKDRSHESFVDLATKSGNVIVTRTLSKAWGAAGLRIGALVGCPEAVAFFGGLRHPYSVTAPAEIMGAYLLDHKRGLMEAICRQSALDGLAMEQALRSSVEQGIFHTMANFVLIASQHADEIERICRDNRILVRALLLPQRGRDGVVREQKFVRANPWDPESQKRFVEIVASVHRKGGVT